MSTWNYFQAPAISHQIHQSNQTRTLLHVSTMSHMTTLRTSSKGSNTWDSPLAVRSEKVFWVRAEMSWSTSKLSNPVQPNSATHPKQISAPASRFAAHLLLFRQPEELRCQQQVTSSWSQLLQVEMIIHLLSKAILTDEILKCDLSCGNIGGKDRKWGLIHKLSSVCPVIWFWKWRSGEKSG